MSEQTPEANEDTTTTEVQDNSQITDISVAPRVPLGEGDFVTEEQLAAMSAKEESPANPIQLPDESYTPRIAEKVSLGRIVEYRSRTGNYSVPAVINCTTNSIYQPGVEAGFVPPISQIDNVHLTVLTPGKPGLRQSAGEDAPVAGAENFLVTSPYPISENVSGCYQEWDIPYDVAGGPGTWKWPERV